VHFGSRRGLCANGQPMIATMDLLSEHAGTEFIGWVQMPYFQLDSDRLEPGDVILEAGAGLISQGIKLVDAGLYRTLGFDDFEAFSHVFIYVGMNFIIEADQDVRSLIASRVITDHPENFLVLRHPEFEEKARTHPVWKSFVGAAAFWAMQPELNKPYNWRGVFGTKLPFLRGKSTGFFCSQLVAETYARIGVEAFKTKIQPDQATPNRFVSDDCLLKPVFDCFVQLPDWPWMTDSILDRYMTIRNEPIPLAEISHQTSQDMVRMFGPRVDRLTARIGKIQTISNPMELYLTLSFPDLPEGDQVSDELVAFMELRYPRTQMANFIALSKVAVEQGILLQDPQTTEVIKRTLRKDIATVKQVLPMLEMQSTMLPVMIRPPLKWRSIHDWIAQETGRAIQQERELLHWREDTLRGLSTN
jgi:hypothetical protein